MIDLTKQYTTRSGLPVNIYDIVSESAKQTHPIIGAYFEDGVWKSRTWMLNGNYDLSLYETDCEMNLIEKPPHNFVKDQLVLVWDINGEPKEIAFYGSYQDNKFYTKSSLSDDVNDDYYVEWNYCEPYYPTAKPLEEGELVVVWNNFRFDKTNFDSYQIRRFVSKTKDDEAYITNTHFDDLANTYIWDNCVRLSEFKL